MRTKRCCKCKRELTLESFNKSKNQKFGRAPDCKQCRSAYRKRHPWKKQGDARLLWVERAIYRAKDRSSTIVEISPDDILALLDKAENKCVYCDKLLSFQASIKERYSKSPSIDRIDPSKGYTTSNVAVCCFRCNQIKSDATPDELRRIADRVEGLLGDHHE